MIIDFDQMIWMLWPIKIRNQFYHKMMCARDKKNSAREFVKFQAKRNTLFFTKLACQRHTILILMHARTQYYHYYFARHCAHRVFIYMDSAVDTYHYLSINMTNQFVLSHAQSRQSTELKSSYSFQTQQAFRTCHITVRQT